MQQKSLFAILAILTPLVLSISLSMDIYVPSLPMIMHDFHTTAQIVQWTLSIYMFGVGIGQLCFGPITDRFGRRKTVLSGLCFYLAGTLACFLAHSMPQLIAGRLLQSIGTCAALVVAYAVVRDLYDSKTSARIYSFLNAVTAGGPVIAPLLGGYLQTYFGTWRASFGFLFLFGIGSLITAFYFLQETCPVEKRIAINIPELKNNYRKIFSSPLFVKNAYHSSVGLTILFVFCCISSYLLIQNLHVSETGYGLAFSSNAIVFITANLTSSYLSKRLNLNTPIKLGSMTIFVGSLMMLLVNQLLGLSIWHFLLPMWILTFGAGLLMGPTVAIALEHFPEIAGTAASVINATQFIVAGVFGTALMLSNSNSAVPFAILIFCITLVSLSLQKPLLKIMTAHPPG